MKKVSTRNHNNGMRDEYDLTTLRGGVRGKYFKRADSVSNLVLIEPDLATLFSGCRFSESGFAIVSRNCADGDYIEARSATSLTPRRRTSGSRLTSRRGVFRLRFRQRLARQHLGAIGRVVDKRSDDGRRLHQVAGLDAVVDVHIGVVRARVVVHRVLNELEAGQAHGVERKVVGAAGIADGNGRSAHVFEGFEPSFEDRPHHVVALQIDAANFAGAVVVVEVAGELGVFRRSFMVSRSPKCSFT